MALPLLLCEDVSKHVAQTFIFHFTHTAFPIDGWQTLQQQISIFDLRLSLAPGVTHVKSIPRMSVILPIAAGGEDMQYRPILDIRKSTLLDEFVQKDTASAGVSASSRAGLVEHYFPGVVSLRTGGIEPYPIHFSAKDETSLMHAIASGISDTIATEFASHLRGCSSKRKYAITDALVLSFPFKSVEYAPFYQQPTIYRSWQIMVRHRSPGVGILFKHGEGVESRAMQKNVVYHTVYPCCDCASSPPTSQWLGNAWKHMQFKASSTVGAFDAWSNGLGRDGNGWKEPWGWIHNSIDGKTPIWHWHHVRSKDDI